MVIFFLNNFKIIDYKISWSCWCLFSCFFAAWTPPGSYLVRLSKFRASLLPIVIFDLWNVKKYGASKAVSTDEEWRNSIRRMDTVTVTLCLDVFMDKHLFLYRALVPRAKVQNRNGCDTLTMTCQTTIGYHFFEKILLHNICFYLFIYFNIFNHIYFQVWI